MPLSIAIFDLQPLWGVSQIYPENSDNETIDNNDERILQLEMWMPEEIKDKRSAVDTLKVFVTVNPTSFRCLEMPDLSETSEQRPSNTRGTDELEKLLDRLGIPTRNVKVHARASQPWITSEIRIPFRPDTASIISNTESVQITAMTPGSNVLIDKESESQPMLTIEPGPDNSAQTTIEAHISQGGPKQKWFNFSIISSFHDWVARKWASEKKVAGFGHGPK